MWNFNICVSRMTICVPLIEGPVTAIVMLKCVCCERKYSFLVFLTSRIRIPLRLIVPVLVLYPESILK